MTDTTNGVPATNTYDAAGRLTALGATTYTYDANGRRTGRTAAGVTTTYSYDAAGRLSGISAPGLSASYTYNGDGLRVSKTVNGQTKPQAWDVLTGRPLTGSDYIYGGGGTLVGGVDDSGRVSYAMSDASGSPELLTDSGGAVTGSTDYGAFGNVRASSGEQPALGLYGGVSDTESGLLYTPAAGYYEPVSGSDLSLSPAEKAFVDRGPSLWGCNASGDCYPSVDNPLARPVVHAAYYSQVAQSGWTIYLAYSQPSFSVWPFPTGQPPRPVPLPGGHITFFIRGPNGESFIFEGIQGEFNRLTATIRPWTPGDFSGYTSPYVICGGIAAACPADTGLRLAVARDIVNSQNLDYALFSQSSNTVAYSTLVGLGFQPAPNACSYFSSCPLLGFPGWGNIIPLPPGLGGG